jgi:hypothetical protein
MSILKVCAGLSLAVLLVAMGCGSSSKPTTDAGGAAGDGAVSSGSGDGSAGKGGAAGSVTTGGGGAKGTCGDIPACLATLFNAGCWPSNTAGPCTKSVQTSATTNTYSYCFANHTKLVIASAVATGDQVQTYSNDSGTCFTATLAANTPETYFNPAGTAVGTEMTTLLDGGTPVFTFMCTGGAPVVVTDMGTCNSVFTFNNCTTDASCQ